jgi:hypothetical protein
MVKELCSSNYLVPSALFNCPSRQSNGVGVAAIEGCQIVWDHVIAYVNSTFASLNLGR